MRSATGRLAALGLALALASVPCALVVCAITPRAASAQSREFAGRVISIGAGQLAVESRQGETLRFVRSERTAVDGRSGWDAIRPGDHVLVRYRLRDGPYEARRVVVLSGG